MTKILRASLPMELYEKLLKKSKQMNISVAAVVRIAITEYLKERE